MCLYLTGECEDQTIRMDEFATVDPKQVLIRLFSMLLFSRILISIIP